MWPIIGNIALELLDKQGCHKQAAAAVSVNSHWSADRQTVEVLVLFVPLWGLNDTLCSPWSHRLVSFLSLLLYFLLLPSLHSFIHCPLPLPPSPPHTHFPEWIITCFLCGMETLIAVKRILCCAQGEPLSSWEVLQLRPLVVVAAAKFVADLQLRVYCSSFIQWKHLQNVLTTVLIFIAHIFIYIKMLSKGRTDVWDVSEGSLSVRSTESKKVELGQLNLFRYLDKRGNISRTLAVDEPFHLFR